MKMNYNNLIEIDDYNRAKNVLKNELIDIFDFYSRYSQKNKMNCLSRISLINLLKKAFFLKKEKIGKFEMNINEFDIYLKKQYPKINEFNINIFIDIILDICKKIYGKINFNNYPIKYSQIISKIIKGNISLIDDSNIFLGRKNINLLIEKNQINEDERIIKIFNNIETSLKILYDHLINKKQYDVFQNLFMFCKTFEIFPFILKQKEFIIYYNIITNNNNENFNYNHFIKFLFHLSILYSINIYNLNDEDLKNMNNKIKMLIEFLTNLNHKKGMNDIKKELQKINIKEILLIPNNCELIDKYSSNYLQYKNDISENHILFKKIFLQYCNKNNQSFELDNLNVNSFIIFIYDLINYNSQLTNFTYRNSESSALNSKRSTSTIKLRNSHLNDFINKDTRFSTIIKPKSLEKNNKKKYKRKNEINKQEIILIYKKNKKENKKFNFECFINSFDDIIIKIFQRKYKKINNEQIKLLSLNDYLIPFSKNKMFEYENENKTIYFFIKESKIYNNNEIFQLLFSFFEKFYKNYCENLTNNIMFSHYIKFLQDYNLYPKIFQISLIKIIYSFILSENKFENEYNFNYENFIHSILILGILINKKKIKDDCSGLIYLINFIYLFRDKFDINICGNDVKELLNNIYKNDI